MTNRNQYLIKIHKQKLININRFIHGPANLCGLATSELLKPIIPFEVNTGYI